MEAIQIPGYWYITKDSDSSHLIAPPRPGVKVILAFHGGDFGRQSAQLKGATSSIIYGVLEYTQPNVFRCLSIEYRISTPPSEISLNTFPAALIDAVAGYNYLVGNIGFSPDDIIVLGDSSGGKLALALARHLLESRRMVEDVTIPLPPGGLILCSPWVNLGPLQQTPPPLHTSTLLRTSSTLLLPRHIN